MMGNGGNGDGANSGQSAFSADDGETDAVAMLGVLASVKGGASSVWDSYNQALAANPIAVKVCVYL